jgi:hypothetical protein
MTDQGRTILRVTLGIGIPLAIGWGVYYVFLRKLNTGQTLFQKWTGDNSQQMSSVSFGVAPDASGDLGPELSNVSKSVGNKVATGFPIGLGATGNNVKLIQQYVNATNMVSPPLVVDGSFGPLTAAGVKATGYNVPVSQSDFQRMTS